MTLADIQLKDCFRDINIHEEEEFDKLLGKIRALLEHHFAGFDLTGLELEGSELRAILCHLSDLQMLIKSSGKLITDQNAAKLESFLNEEFKKKGEKDGEG